MRRSFRVLNPEAKRWRAEAACGAPVRRLAKAAARDPKTIRRHLLCEQFASMRARAVRLEGLFSACNRALARAAR
ncbi:hypothetical protein [Methylorubrum salsuginis]|uniref:Uncharacterized protein n=1 Tax=Methylorubrum salsuginis TaxID=414703 RepID=A0A1I4FM86_9HYPH|nr:hypothetical protein [Methylorubrum salsuginis]SFL17976.1 hypothetical protein SAMN04488125_11070 [Methylorubrum salsuginis]